MTLPSSILYLIGVPDSVPFCTLDKVATKSLSAMVKLAEGTGDAFVKKLELKEIVPYSVSSNNKSSFMGRENRKVLCPEGKIELGIVGPKSALVTFWPEKLKLSGMSITAGELSVKSKVAGLLPTSEPSLTLVIEVKVLVASSKLIVIVGSLWTLSQWSAQFEGLNLMFIVSVPSAILSAKKDISNLCLNVYLAFPFEQLPAIMVLVIEFTI